MADQVVNVGINATMNVSQVLSAVQQIQGGLKNLKIPSGIGDNLTKSLNNATDLLKKYQSQLDKGVANKTDAKAIAKTGSEIEKVLSEVNGYITELSNKEIYLKTDYSGIQEFKTKIEEAKAAYLDAIKTFGKQNNVYTVLDQIAEKTTRSGLTQGSISQALNLFNKGDMEAYASAIDEVIGRISKLSESTIKNTAANLLGINANEITDKAAGLDIIKKKLEEIRSIDLTSDNGVKQLSEALSNVQKDFDKFNAGKLEQGANALSKVTTSGQDAASSFDALNRSVEQFNQQTLSAVKQVEQLQQSTQYFFSLRNMINLLKRGVREAVDTVKELDKAMTQTAVVTNFSVSDMWEKLPEYTANANALGASVKDMYEATTLYYQQGLNTEQSMSIAAETMKMARIGGLEAADATDKMTAALRGFNMEINETSAKRVNDVYSNLAAKTASNTEELGTAMQRTASIAASAGMSFEGTAAFLAQAIETTREPAENLGTAMKTIVARFTELKKNPLEITEVDGEEVSYNKIDTALQSIGVSLKDANGQFRDLDQVFLDISQRWDSLSQTQQRYIATTAAGSRQQSRFIAMMSNYDRTVQLMNYANNSAGASNEQFGKTMESLEAKLNKLRNAWQQFEMGITNNELIKGAVDGLTGILDVVNNLIDKLSLGSGVLKSGLSIFTAFMGLKAGGNIINKMIGGLGGLVDPTSSFGKGFWNAGKATDQNGNPNGIAGKITTPIVAKLSELIAVTKGQKLTDKAQATSTVGQYKSVAQALRLRNLGDMGTVSSLLGSLSDEHAYAVYRNAPGTVDAMKQASLTWFNNINMSRDTQKIGQQLMSNIFRGMQKKEIPIKEGVKLLGKPQQWGKYFGTKVAQEFSQQFVNRQKGLRTAQIITARQQAWAAAGGHESYSDEDIKQYLKENQGSDFAKAVAAQYKKIRSEQQQTIASLSTQNLPLEKYQQLANNVGLVGSKFSAAGLSIQMFGSQLSQLSPALQGVGSLLMQLGTAINVAGMGFSGIGNIVTGIGGRISTGMALAKATTTGVTATGGEIASNFMAGFTGGMSAGPIAAIITGIVVGGIMIAKSIIEKKAQKAGEEVRKSFEDGFTKNDEKLKSIEGYQSRFEELSKGVDQFGHNIDLSNEDYNEYLSISRDLSQLSPSLIAGYNAEGEAILKKGKALDEVISKLKEEKQLALDSYITNDSINKLIGEFKTSDAYKDNNRQTDSKGEGRVKQAFQSEIDALKKASSKANLEFDVADAISQLSGQQIDNLSQLTTEQLLFVSQHYNDILNLLEEKNGQLDEKVEEGFKEAFGNLGSAIEDVTTEGQPIIDAMQQWMGQEKLDAVGIALGEEFSNNFTQGFNAIMTNSLVAGDSAEVIKDKLRAYSQEWQQLGGATSEYSKILSEADDIQEQYLDHIGEQGAIQNYESNVENLAVKLEDLASQYENTGQAGKAFAEQCIQQANALRNYATEGVLTLAEALNSLADEFASARGAQERFEKATEGGDFYTAAEGYKSIIETVLDEKNVLGDGSLTAWAGADELLGKEFVDSHNWDEIVNQIERVQDCFADGSEGIIAFNDYLTEMWETAGGAEGALAGLGTVGEDGFEFNLQNEDLAEYAELLNMSEDALAALIDKARQWVPIDLGDTAKIRQALETGGQAMVGQDYSGGKSALYTAESSFRQEARQQGIRGEAYAQTKSDIEQQQNVKFLTVENLTNKDAEDYQGLDKVLSDIGLEGTDQNLDNTVAALTKMGFDLQEQKDILTADGIKLQEGAISEDQIEQAYKEQEFAVDNPTVAGIANDTGVIASAATAMLAKMGILTEQAKADIEASTSESNIQSLEQGLKPREGFKTTKERNAAVDKAIAEKSKIDATIANLKASGNESLQPYIEDLQKASDRLDVALTNEDTRWQSRLKATKDIIGEIGTIDSEQQFLDAHSVDIQEAFNSGDANQLTDTLVKIQTEGNLSAEAMVALIENIKEFDESGSYMGALNDLLATYNKAIEEARNNTNEPFRLQFDNSTDFQSYILTLDQLTGTQRNILLNTTLKGSDKVTTFLDQLSEDFGGGDETKKSIIIEATAKMASGDNEGALDLLKTGFKSDEAETIQKDLDVVVNGSIANKDEVVEALESEVDGLSIDATVNTNINADLSNLKSDTPQNLTVGVSVQRAELDNVESEVAAGGDFPVRADDQASPVINSLKKTESKTIDVYARQAGSWTFTVNTVPNKRGRNYSIPAHQTLSFGAAAEGMNIPKTKKSSASMMTALVGEEGFEVGYIPSERRSMILGANGPEITSLPKDVVIYPHRQSKDIVRRGKNGHATLGSFQYGTDNVKSKGLLTNISSGSTKTITSSDSDTQKKNKDNADKAEKTIDKIGKVSVWWENIARRTEAWQRKADKNQKAYEKYLAQLQATLKETGTIGQGDKYINNLDKVKKLNEKQVKQADKELKSLNSKKNKSTTISYKKGKDTKEEKISLAKYIKKKDGTWVVDQKQLNSVKSKEKRKAIADAANKELDDRLSKKYKAEDEITKAQEALEEFSKKLYETFFAWENELTSLWNITQKLNNNQLKIDRIDQYNDLLSAQLASGLEKATTAFNQKTISAFQQSMDMQVDTINKRQQAITENTNALNQALSLADEQATLNSVNAKLNSGTLNETEKAGYQKYAEELQNQINTIAQAQSKYLNVTRYQDGTVGVDFNSQALENDKQAGLITEETYKTIKDYVDKINEANQGLNEAYKSLTEDLTKLYQTLADLREEYANNAEELVSTLESAQNKQLDKLKKLSDGLTKAFKDLIEEVKRKITERRQQEDNIKTEQDIQKKQQRLAALRADTSGGHAVEIAQLEKEIADAQQSYGRTLEDQLLDKLQQQGDIAEKQRQRQIELQEALLDATNNAAQVNMWLEALKNPNLKEEDKAKIKAEMWEAYKVAQDYDSKTDPTQKNIESRFETLFSNLDTFDEKESATVTAINGAKSALETVTTSINNLKTAIESNTLPANNGNNGEGGGNGNPAAEQTHATTSFSGLAGGASASSGGGSSGSTNKKQILAARQNDIIRAGVFTLDSFHALEQAAQAAGIEKNVAMATVISSNKDGLTWFKLAKLLMANNVTQAKLQYYGGYSATAKERINAAIKDWNKNNSKKYSTFKTGGLATSTGPAWLDGTPSKPELVLNAADTKNFIALKDVLSQAMKSTSGLSGSYVGDTTYEININVDKIEKDYDVDKMAERIKKIIVKDASYRNVTQVRNFR